jgi:N-acyl-D-aspartate/D-glutamate deacylase
VSGPECYLQLADETDGRALLNWPFLNQSGAAVEELITHPAVLLGLADAGAHVGQIMDASQPTWFLAHWVRDRGLWSLEEGIAKLTSIPASLFELGGRGVLAEGAFADVNVFSLDDLALPLPTFEHDFPGGAGRWVQGGEGYDLTLVNGVATVEQGVHTGALPGRTLRSTD